jgi:ankyrin repeat protein
MPRSHINVFVILWTMVGLLGRDVALAQAPSDLIEAANGQDRKTVLAMLKRGANPNTRWSNGQTILMWAAGYEDREIVRFLLEKGAHVNAIDENKKSPLHYAATAYHVVPPKWHAEAGFQGDYIKTVSPLKVYDVLKLLVDKGADINAKDDKCETALNYVIGSFGRPDCVKLLLDRGADPNARSGESHTPMVAAMRWMDRFPKNRLAVVRLLLDRGTDLAPVYGNTWQFEAASNGWIDILRLMIDRGADINARNPDGGETAVMAASFSKDTIGTLKYLLKRGAAINLLDDAGRTALDIATFRENKKAVELLRLYGAQRDEELPPNTLSNSTGRE